MKDLWLTYPIGSVIVMIIAIAVSLILIVNIIQDYQCNPFQYPCIRQRFDLTGKRQPSYIEYIDMWLINMDFPRQNIKTMYNNMLKQWEKDCDTIIENAWLWKSRKRKLYDSMKEEVMGKDYKVFMLMILALSGQHSCNIRTRFLNYADRIPITLGQHS